MQTTHSATLRVLRNRTFDEISVGDSIERGLTAQDIQFFAVISGDVNPTHLDAEHGASTRFHGVIANGMWGDALISALPAAGARGRHAGCALSNALT